MKKKFYNILSQKSTFQHSMIQLVDLQLVIQC